MIADAVVPNVEGHLPTKIEMDAKARSGPKYKDDVNLIKHEFHSHQIYKTNACLETMASRNSDRVAILGYDLCDASHLFNGIQNGLVLLEKWATVVHTARTSKKMIIVRRTPENCGAVLMLQRLEHLRGFTTEWSPLAYAVLVRDDQQFITRDQVGSVDRVDTNIQYMASTQEMCHLCNFFLGARVSTTLPCGHAVHSDCLGAHLEKSRFCPICDASCGECVPTQTGIEETLKKFELRSTTKDHNIPAALFAQEISLLRELQRAEKQEKEEEEKKEEEKQEKEKEEKEKEEKKEKEENEEEGEVEIVEKFTKVSLR
jgi:hypothetical protein